MSTDPDPSSPVGAPTGRRLGTTAEQRALLLATGLYGLVALTGLALKAALPTALAAVLAAALVVGLTVALPRRLTATVVAGLAWWSVCSVGTVAILRLADTAQHSLVLGLAIGAAGGLGPCAVWAWLQRAQGRQVTEILGETSRAFTEPTSGLPALFLGTGLALPLIGSYAPAIGDPDSAWFVTSTQTVQREGPELLRTTQDVFVPHFTLGPLLSLGGYRLAIPFMIFTLMGLSALTAYLAYRLTGRGAASITASAALLAMPAILERADRLPMYAAAFTLAYGSGWLLHRAMSEPDSPRWWPALAGFGFVLTYEAHGVGQIFLAVPFLLLVLHPWREARRSFLISLATIAVLSVPRIAVNLGNISEGGFRGFRTNYSDFMVQKYLPIVNRDYWGQNNDTSPVGYLTNLPKLVDSALGSWSLLLLLAVPITLAALRSGPRARRFSVTCFLFFMAALSYNSPGTYGRYLTPLAVGAVLVAAVGIATALRDGGDGRTLGRIMILALVAAAFFQMVQMISVKVQERETIVGGPWPDLAASIDDDRAVMGIRPHELLYTDPSIPIAYSRTMDEEDWVTYLSWPDDEAVLEMMDDYDVGWVYVMPRYGQEVEYHQTWLEPVYGLDVSHVDGIHESDRFCLAADSEGYLLYRVGECQPGDAIERPDEFLEAHAAGATQYAAEEDGAGDEVGEEEDDTDLPEEESDVDGGGDDPDAEPETDPGAELEEPEEEAALGDD